MVFQYLDDVCESVNLTIVYSATLSVGEKNLEPIFLGQCVRQTLNNGITLICACLLKQIPAKKVVMNECRYVEHAST